MPDDRSDHAGPRRTPARSPWLLRVVVLIAFAATAWYFGPRAVAVVSAQLTTRSLRTGGQEVAIGRVGVLALPTWLQGPLRVACFDSLEEHLRGTVPILDDAAALRLEAALAASPFVAQARIERHFPDRFRVRLRMREPVIAVFEQLPGTTTRGPVCVVDEQGVCLPSPGALDLPRVVTRQGFDVSALGKPHPDRQVVAAAAVAAEWRTSLVPLLPAQPPKLIEVDASNLDYRLLADGRLSEILVGLARSDGQTAWFAYTHPPGSAWHRVACEDMAKVLKKVLAKYPGLAGVERGDLRLPNRWEQWLRVAKS